MSKPIMHLTNHADQPCLPRSGQYFRFVVDFKEAKDTGQLSFAVRIVTAYLPLSCPVYKKKNHYFVRVCRPTALRSTVRTCTAQTRMNSAFVGTARNGFMSLVSAPLFLTMNGSASSQMQCYGLSVRSFGRLNHLKTCFSLKARISIKKNPHLITSTTLEK